MQLFKSRILSIRELQARHDRGELDLTPEFQRREVWSDKARSFLVDTIIRGKPIPQLYIRTLDNPSTGKSIDQVVDGQQRLKTIFLFLKDGFPINKAHYPELGGKYFSQLEPSLQKMFTNYELTIDYLMDAQDKEIWDIFARLNRYPVKINAQELRNSQYFGDFKSSVYQISRETRAFWIGQGIFTPNQVSRMAEAEFVSELLIAMSVGTRAKEKRIIDRAYEDWDGQFPNSSLLAKRFLAVIDFIGAILAESDPASSLRRVPLFYTLFCSIYHMQYGLPATKLKKAPLRLGDMPKIRVALEVIDSIFAVDKNQVRKLPNAERRFRNATDVHTIHAANRLIRLKYMVGLLNKAARS